MMEKIFSPDTYSMLGQWALGFCKNLIVAVVVYFVGSWLIKWAKKLFVKMLERSKVDPTLFSFLTSIVSVVLWFTLVIIIISILGIETSSFIALFASAGVAIGMALSGTLQNFAGGLMIMAFKPFKAGDYIEALGYAGTVTEVTIVGTHLTTIDNRRVILPNGALSSGNVVNYSSFPLRRIDLVVGVEYGTDAAACKEKLLSIVREDPRLLDAATPGAADPLIAVKALSASSVDFLIRVWVRGSEYWTVYYSLNERIYTELPQAGIRFPFPQLDVHLRNKD